MNPQNIPSGSSQKSRDLSLKYFQIRNKAKFCIALICIVQVIIKLAGVLGDPTMTPNTRTIYIISCPFSASMVLIIAFEYFLAKKRGPDIVKYSTMFDVSLLIIFMFDWIAILISSIYRTQPGNPPCFKIGSLYGFSSFSWRTLLVTLIVQKWQLKIIAPVTAVIVATGYAIHFTGGAHLGWTLARASVQLFNIILIVYCEDKVRWNIMWTNLQQEKWMQVNNFILNNLPENIMILDFKGEAKFISDYCKSFMKKCRIPLDNTKDLFKKIRDLQQQYEPEPASPGASFIQVERLTTGLGLLGDMNEHNPNLLSSAETLESLVLDFKNLVTQKTLQERQFVVYNGKLKTENHHERSIEVKISFVQHFEHEFIILILRDTTQRDLLVTLEETNKYKDQLLASVSHELRAPLNGNINLVESAVQSPEVPENIKEALLTPALRSSKFLLHIINDILDMSQIKEKKLRLVFQPGDLRETLRSAAQLVELQARKKGVQLDLEFDDNLPRSFCTDHVRLSQIVLNLLNNAIKFTREGVVKLVATPMFEVPWVRISVEDSGIGMSQENLEKLFSSYTHIEFEGRQVMNPTGVGLGLNIAFNLSQMLAPKDQGGITVTSLQNKGSTFSFIIENKSDSPLELDLSEKPSNSVEVADEWYGDWHPIFFEAKYQTNTSAVAVPLVSKEKASESQSSAVVEEGCQCPKVLVVDDNPFNTMAFETILNSLDVKCESVYSGSCCLKKLLESQNNSCGKECKRYSVIFMDQEMPEMNGADTVKEIKILQGGGQIGLGIKIIGCTAHKSEEEVDKFLEAGLDQCIHKPISKIMINDILKDSKIL